MLAQYGLHERNLFFMSRLDTAVELVGTCEPPWGKQRTDESSWCKVLAHSQQDGLAFGVVFPFAELGRLNEIVERPLGLIRSWRIQA